MQNLQWRKFNFCETLEHFKILFSLLVSAQCSVVPFGTYLIFFIVKTIVNFISYSKYKYYFSIIQDFFNTLHF